MLRASHGADIGGASLLGAAFQGAAQLSRNLAGRCGPSPKRERGAILGRLLTIGDDPNQLTADDKKYVHAYDYMRRRVRTRVYTWDPNTLDWSATPDEDQRFMYHGRQRILTLNESESVVQQLFWGPWAYDQGCGSHWSALRQFLAMRDYSDPNSVDYIAFHDGAGNLCQLVDRSDGSIDAKYDFNGRTRAAIGECEDPNSLDDCDQCGPCFFGYYPRADGSFYTICGCGPASCSRTGHPGTGCAGDGCGPFLLVFPDTPGPACPGGGCADPQDRCERPLTPLDCAACYPPCPSSFRPNNPDAPVNGCSSPLGDSPSGVSFREACNEHDRCYGTCGRSKEDCDAEFLHDMLAACEAASLDSLSASHCRFWAYAYYTAVQRYGGPYYNAAQRKCLPPIGPPPPSVHPCVDIARNEFFDCMLATNGDERHCLEAADAVYERCCRDAAVGGLPCPRATRGLYQ